MFRHWKRQSKKIWNQNKVTSFKIELIITTRIHFWKCFYPPALGLRRISLWQNSFESAGMKVTLILRKFVELRQEIEFYKSDFWEESYTGHFIFKPKLLWISPIRSIFTRTSSSMTVNKWPVCIDNSIILTGVCVDSWGRAYPRGHKY